MGSEQNGVVIPKMQIGSGTENVWTGEHTSGLGVGAMLYIHSCVISPAPAVNRPELAMGPWVTTQIGHRNFMGHMGQRSTAVDPSVLVARR